MSDQRVYLFHSYIWDLVIGNNIMQWEEETHVFSVAMLGPSS